MDTSFPKHIDWLKKQLLKHTKETLIKLEKLGIEPWIIPKAGIFIWCKLPEGIHASKLSQLCLKQNIILAPGNAFSQSEGAECYMRFNVAQCIDKKIFDVLAEVIFELQQENLAEN